LDRRIAPDLAWIEAHRVGKAQAGLDAATEVRGMRDEAEFWEDVSG